MHKCKCTPTPTTTTITSGLFLCHNDCACLVVHLSHLPVLFLFPSFSQDVPKDYRHVSLTGVKQRFEDEMFQQISKEPVSTDF